MPTVRAERGSENLVGLYLADISRYPLLTRPDELRLAQQIESATAAREVLLGGEDLTGSHEEELRRAVARGEDAYRTFVQSNLRLVVSIAKRYYASGVPILDLVQEGNFGLMRAVEKFDWRKGFAFSTYATWWVRQSIARGISNSERMIRIPVHTGNRLARVQMARAGLDAKLGRPGTVRELAAEVDLSEDMVAGVLQLPSEPLSLSAPLNEDSDSTMGELIADRLVESPFEQAAAALLPAAIEKLLAPLKERERRVLTLRFGLASGEPLTLAEVGKHFNLTRERIRQIEIGALSKLRERSTETGAADLLAG